MSKIQYGCQQSGIAHYTAHQIAEPLSVDGNLAKSVWQRAERSPRFVDMVTGAPGFYNTQASILWDQEHLYIGVWVEEPFLCATQTERDSIVFLDNDVEVFIDGGDCYYELEINVLNTIYEVFFIWRDAYQRGSKFDVSEFDVYDDQALTFGGDYDRTGPSFWKGRHPRGLRWAFLNWDMPGLKTAVRAKGKINDDSIVDEGWEVEIAIPWRSLHWLASGRSLPPKEGDTWRIFVGRFQKLIASGQEIQPHPAWVWSKHEVYDTHVPECFPFIHFTEAFL
ncbi:carbohydrate-binding family 9-like protein [Paracnuella aquatica]|uniref:carbohydrate-binding family 9-like protein n=1 Tax=Paracnuella aquatica TaxID=2268757 RepID=UPI000DEF33BC|nr:carbohydrate-binding family 9-like protein [Paracnuella aquatica]RPD47266.1 hypothetical protein DRJ53_12200 [Paracnuella aquatica]